MEKLAETVGKAYGLTFKKYVWAPADKGGRSFDADTKKHHSRGAVLLGIVFRLSISCWKLV